MEIQISTDEKREGTPAVRAETMPKREMVKIIDNKGPYQTRDDTPSINTEVFPKREMAKIVDNKGPYQSLDNTTVIKAEEVSKREMVKTVVEQNISNDPITMDVLGTKGIIDNGCLFSSNDVTLFPIPNTNASMAIVEVVDGENPRYKCLVSINNGITREITIPVSKFNDGRWLRDIPCLGIVGGAKAVGIISNFLNHYVMNYKGIISREIEKPGWTLEQNQLIYVTPKGVLGKPNLPVCSKYGQTFPEISSLERTGDVKAFLELGKLTRTNPAATIIYLYIVVSFLNSWYKRVNLPVKFSIFLHGPRGSLKTSLALAMTQIEDRSTAKYTLKSTGAGLEAGFRRYKDAIMLIDDLMPTQDAAEQRALQHNLELMVRCFGDANGKERNGDFQSRPIKTDYKAEGGAIITGEYITGVASSLSRSLFLSLREGDVDTKLLSVLQADSKFLTRFLIGFFSYLEKNVHHNLTYIKQRCVHYRDSVQGNYSNRRYAEYYADLMAASDLLLQYGYDTGQLTIDEKNFYGEYHRQLISLVIETNSSELKTEEPIVHMCNAIIEGIESGAYPLVVVGGELELYESTIMEDINYFYIPQPLLKRMKETYDKKYGNTSTVLTSSSKYISNLLYEHNVIELFWEGKRKRYSKKMNGCGHTRYTMVRKDKLKEFSII